MGGKGSVVAYERNEARSKVLEKMVRRAGAGELVRVENCDFTSSYPHEIDDVARILCDPSCSGSGIFRKEEFKSREHNEAEGLDEQEDAILASSSIADDDELATRLVNLAFFQTKIVKHALVHFPNVKRVVYSTCSVHGEENEDVVRALLMDPEVAKLGWRLMKREDVIPTWHRRGWQARFEGMQEEGYCQSAQELAEGCVRAEPVADGGIGFFVAGFEKVGEPLKFSIATGKSGKRELKEDEEEVEEWNGFGEEVTAEPTVTSNKNEIALNEPNKKKKKRKRETIVRK